MADSAGKVVYAPLPQREDAVQGSNVKSVHIPMEDDEEGQQKEFVPSHGLTSSEATALLARWGRNELEEKNKPKVKFAGYQTGVRCVANLVSTCNTIVVDLLGTAEGAYASDDLDCSDY